MLFMVSSWGKICHLTGDQTKEAWRSIRFARFLRQQHRHRLLKFPFQIVESLSRYAKAELNHHMKLEPNTRKHCQFINWKSITWILIYFLSECTFWTHSRKEPPWSPRPLWAQLMLEVWCLPVQKTTAEQSEISSGTKAHTEASSIPTQKHQY